MLSNIHKNIMGTVSFDGLFAGMRKPQDFIVYPMSKDNEHPMLHARIQSDKRSGLINLSTGAVELFAGQYFLGNVKKAGTLSNEQLLMFKAAIFATASGKAGTNGIVHCDNAGAIEIF